MEVLAHGKDTAPRHRRGIAVAVTLAVAIALAGIAAYGLLRHGPAPTQIA